MDWYRVDVNPEPWAIGPVGTGRRGGKIWAYVGQNAQLATYQNAVRESIEYPKVIEGDIALIFLFWRNVQAKQRKHDADVTNMQKATEDALQGILYENDRATRHVSSVLVEQGADVNGMILIGIEKYVPPAFPFEAIELLQQIHPAEVEYVAAETYDLSPEEVF